MKIRNIRILLYSYRRIILAHLMRQTPSSTWPINICHNTSIPRIVMYHQGMKWLKAKISICSTKGPVSYRQIAWIQHSLLMEAHTSSRFMRHTKSFYRQLKLKTISRCSWTRDLEQIQAHNKSSVRA